MRYTLGEAAKAVGKTKAAIWQAIAAQMLRAEKDEKNRWQIDPEELFRIYPPLTDSGQKETVKEGAKRKESEHDFRNEISVLKERVKGLEELCAELRVERDDWQKSAADWREQTKRVMSVLAIEKQQQIEKWEHGAPTVIEVPPTEQREGQEETLSAPEASSTATKKSLWWWPPSWLMVA